VQRLFIVVRSAINYFVSRCCIRETACETGLCVRERGRAGGGVEGRGKEWACLLAENVGVCAPTSDGPF
jgi:hypothetical protein